MTLNELFEMLSRHNGSAPIVLLDNHEEEYELTGIAEVVDGAICIGIQYKG